MAGEQNGQKIEATLPARTILVAAGTQPNTVLAREDATHAFIDGKYFRALDEEGEPVTPEKVCKPAEVRVLMYRAADGRFMSFFGDLHPSFAGNVVKAMGGAKQGYPVLTRTMERLPAPKRTPGEILEQANDEWRARVVRVERLTPTIVEVVVEAHAAARNFEPGQFYRLQNYEARSKKVDGTLLTMEGLALTGAWVDKDKGLLSLITLEMGGSSDLCALLEPGEPVIVMGPTGTPTEIEPGETVVLAGGGLGNAVLFSIGQAFRKAGSKVLYFAGYKKVSDRYKVEEIEAAADVVVWACDEEPGFTVDRPQDKAVVANIVEAMRRYASGELGEQPIPFSAADRIIAIGSDGMMNAVRLARRSVLKPYLKARPPCAGIDQLAHAMHDEGDLRPVPAAPSRSGDGQGIGGLLLLQPGPGARPRRLRLPAPAPAPERRAGKDRRAVDRPVAAQARGAITACRPADRSANSPSSPADKAAEGAPMTTTLHAPKVRKLADASRVEFGPLAFYHPLIADGDTPVRTGIQTSAPGYVAPMHWHPYVELLFIIEGQAEVWLQGGEAEPMHLDAGDCVALPADIPHSFRTVGDKPMRLLGIHSNPDRVVNYLDRKSDASGYPVLDDALEPVTATART